MVSNKKMISTHCRNYAIVPKDPPNNGILFVDHSRIGRSGHLGHALVEYEDNKILAFYPNCSDDKEGHSAIGWMEYKRSENGGITWSEAYTLDYSRELFNEKKGVSSFSEKAVRASDGTIVLFNLVCDISSNAGWEPFLIPTCIKSRDGGHTWTKARNLSDKRGRIYDAIFHGEEIFVLEFCNDATDTWTGNAESHIYCLYVSDDYGNSFTRRSEIPLATYGRGYGTMEVLRDGSIIVYVYNINDEKNPDYIISKDRGYTWSDTGTSYFVKKIRNPQMVHIGDYYFMHGRSGNSGEASGNFVLYSSMDGMTWDAGTYLRMQEAGHGSYSNSLVTGTLNPDKSKKLLIQSSHAYEGNKTNILHWWIENISGA